ncbi:aspartate/glutamate racemase family protein, partial [Stappia sp.]|uniref:aspartate/glutamate racemase family protein n=1 Tax=Stappia sp. TaxID=1870903 RepID=UPI003A9973C5
ASTLVLPPLRQALDIPVVGTVPAIKPAAERTRSGLVSVLATPGTVSRDYTFDLIRRFAPDVAITLVGSKRLASLAEDKLAGRALDMQALTAEAGACFVSRDDRRTDVVVLACTHFPLLAGELAAAAPWPVEWLDPAPAIARRLRDVIAVGTSDGSEQLASAPLDKVTATSGKDLSRFLPLMQAQPA